MSPPISIMVGLLFLKWLFPSWNVATMTFVFNWTETAYHGQIANFTHYLFKPSEPPCDNVSWKKKSSVAGMDWSTCRGRFGKVSVHTNMTFVDWGPHCRGPAPVDPGNSKGGRRWRGKTCLLI